VSHAAILLVALLLDALLGEPRWLWDRLPHPAVLMGRAISWSDRIWNHPPRARVNGALLVVLLVVLLWVLGSTLARLPGGALVEVIVAAVLLAQKSLAEHVNAVARALRLSLGDGRLAVAQIVGRDTREMQPADIARAAIESTAENLSDGVIAPAFWFLILGLPGLLIYKAINTADSMIGHMTDQHRDFGRAAARLDDALNFVPARITAGLAILVTSLRVSVLTLRTEAALHRSPNAGWPEASFAHGLGVALSGPRSYQGTRQDYPFVNRSSLAGLVRDSHGSWARRTSCLTDAS
jgi:adenosylcobinamide-phosphate synthase